MASRYNITFKTLFDNKVSIDIIPKGAGNSSVVSLIGTSEPFEIETDNSLELDTTVRATTGTLRLAIRDDSDAAALSEILPSEIFGTRVDAYLEKDGESILKFTGYIELTEFSQPWDGTPYVMELPVRDALSVMGDVEMEAEDDSYFATEATFAKFLVEAFGAVAFQYSSSATKGLTPSKVRVIAGSYGILSAMIQREWYLTESTETNADSSSGDAVSTPVVNGATYREALERVLMAYAMTMWVEDDVLYISSINPYGTYYEMSWSDIADFLAYNSPPPGAEISNIGGLSSPILLGSAYYNMSDSNTVGWVQPLKRVLVSQKLSARTLFELSNNWLSAWQKNSLGSFTTNRLIFEYMNYKATTTQRGLTLYRKLYSTKADYNASYDIAAKTSAGSEIFGAAIGGAFHWRQDEDDDVMSLGSLTPAIVLATVDTPATLEMEDSSLAANYDQYVGLKFISPVVIYPEKGGCLCLNFSQFDYYWGDTTEWRGIGLKEGLAADSSSDGSFYPCAVYVKLRLVSTGSGASYFWTGASWLAESSSNTVYFPLWQMDGSLLSNVEGNVGADYASSSSKKKYAYGLAVNDRLKYKDGEGYFMPLDSLKSSGAFSVEVSVLSMAYVYGDHRTVYDERLVGIQGLTLKYCPLILSGDAFEGDYSLLSDNDEKTTVYAASGNGDDGKIELDTWGDGSGVKESTTVQPDLPIWDAAAAKQFSKIRKTILLDDARALLSPVNQYKESSSDSNFYIPVGGSWKAWNEGGEKKLVQCI